MFDNMDGVEIFISFMIAAGVLGGVGYAIGSSRGRGPLGFLLGFLLGPIGWIIALLLPREGRRCDECRGVLEPGARRCCHCGAEVATFARRPQLPPTESGWYVSKQGRSDGPFTLAQLRALLDSGALSATDLAARAGDDEWVRVGDVLGITKSIG